MQIETLGCDTIAKRAEHKKLIRDWAVASIIFELIPGVLLYLLAPGYILPFLNHPVGRLILLLLFAWTIIGWSILCSIPFATRWKCNSMIFLVTMMCTVPFLLTPLIGPATIAILDAFGPVMTHNSY